MPSLFMPLDNAVTFGSHEARGGLWIALLCTSVMPVSIMYFILPPPRQPRNPSATSTSSMYLGLFGRLGNSVRSNAGAVSGRRGDNP